MKRWFYSVLISVLCGLCVIMALMIFFDPYFHFHGPIQGISYRISEERYINDGIVKNFEYDALITGSSMNQNFKTSTMDALFGTTSIKVPFSGAGYEEISDNIRRALEHNENLKLVLWGLDYNGLNRDYDWQGYEEYPEYLYDKNPLNDVSYIFNKNILVEGLVNNILQTLSGEPTTTFDEYSSWDVGSGWDRIAEFYQRTPGILPMETITEEEVERVTLNIQKNIVDLAKDYPDTQFILFYAPYSALYWEFTYRYGWLEKQLEMEKIATELMLECENISLFNFHSETQITGDLNNYRDKEHYVDEINDLILQWIVEKRGLVTRDNYLETIAWEWNYYIDYDYDSLYEGYEHYMIPSEEY